MTYQYDYHTLFIPFIHIFFIALGSGWDSPCAALEAIEEEERVAATTSIPRMAVIRILPCNHFVADSSETDATSAAASEASANGDGEENKEDDSSSAKPSYAIDADPPAGFEAYPDDNKFGFGDIFSYPISNNIKDLQHEKYLKDVCEYYSEFNAERINKGEIPRNVLLVRASLQATEVDNDEREYEYIFGMFIPRRKTTGLAPWM